MQWLLSLLLTEEESFSIIIRWCLVLLFVSCTVEDKWSLVSTEIGVVSDQLVMQNVNDDQHQIERIGIQKFNNVKMSQICDKNIYFM